MDKNKLLERISALCGRKDISMNTAFIESGVGKNFKSNMKTSRPSLGKLTMLADYFAVPVGYLTGELDSPADPKAETRIIGFVPNEHEQAVLAAYRAHPEMQNAVDRLLGVEKISVYVAAHDSASFDEKIEMEKEKWEQIKNTPDEDERLL